MATSTPASSPAPTAAPAKRTKYIAVTPVDFDNKRYETDKPLFLDEETARPLLARGAIKPAVVAKEEPAA